jgi:hypothetical protein
LLLAATSPVFASLLYPAPPPRTESKDEKNDTGNIIKEEDLVAPFAPLTSPLEIKVDGINVDIFRTLLRAIYSDKVDLSNGISLKLLSTAARRYKITKVLQACTQATTTDLSLSNCLSTLIAIDADEAAEVLKYVCEHTHDLVNSPTWLELPVPILSLILSDDRTSCDELSLFTSLQRWAKAEAKRQGKGDTPTDLAPLVVDLIKHIRFPLMNVGEIASVVSVRYTPMPYHIISYHSF